MVVKGLEHQAMVAPMDAPWLGEYVDESGNIMPVPIDDTAVNYPATDEEFELMFQQFESEGLLLD